MKLQELLQNQVPRLFFVNCTKEVNLIYFFNVTVQTTAHAQKVACLDIGETGRVLVTGGADRLVNLFAIGNDKPIQVSGKIQLCERSDDENEVKSLMSVGSVRGFIANLQIII